jgi:hypothetical protein
MVCHFDLFTRCVIDGTSLRFIYPLCHRSAFQVGPGLLVQNMAVVLQIRFAQSQPYHIRIGLTHTRGVALPPFEALPDGKAGRERPWSDGASVGGCIEEEELVERDESGCGATVLARGDSELSEAEVGTSATVATERNLGL